MGAGKDKDTGTGWCTSAGMRTIRLLYDWHTGQYDLESHSLKINPEISDRERQAMELFTHDTSKTTGQAPSKTNLKKLWDERNYAELEEVYRTAPDKVNEATPFGLLKMLSEEKAKGSLPKREEEWRTFYTDVLERLGAADYKSLSNALEEFDNAMGAKMADAEMRKKTPKALLYSSGNELYAIPIKDGKTLGEETLVTKAPDKITGIDQLPDRRIVYSCYDSKLHWLDLKDDDYSVRNEGAMKLSKSGKALWAVKVVDENTIAYSLDRWLNILEKQPNGRINQYALTSADSAISAIDAFYDGTIVYGTTEGGVGLEKSPASSTWDTWGQLETNLGEKISALKCTGREDYQFMCACGRQVYKIHDVDNGGKQKDYEGRGFTPHFDFQKEVFIDGNESGGLINGLDIMPHETKGNTLIAASYNQIRSKRIPPQGQVKTDEGNINHGVFDPTFDSSILLHTKNYGDCMKLIYDSGGRT